MKMVSKMDPKLTLLGAVFDCTGAYGLYMSPHRGAPKATQNYTKTQTDCRNLFFPGKIRKCTKNDTQEVSKSVTLYRANVPLVPLGSALVPQSVFLHQKWTQSAPKVPLELKSTPKSDPEGPQKFKKSWKTTLSLPGPADCAKRLE